MQDINDFLNQSISLVEGFGISRKFLLNKVGIFNLRDLLFFFPKKFLIFNTISNDYIFLKAKVIAKIKQGKVWIIKISANDKEYNLMFFNPKPFSYFFPNKEYKIYGILKENNNVYNAKIIYSNQAIVPFYKTSISSVILNKIINNTIAKLPNLFEEKFFNDLNFKKALFNLHNGFDLENSLNFMKFIEATLFLNIFKQTENYDKIILNKDFLQKLPFIFNEEQNQAFNEITNNLESEKPLRHIVFGEVGSGKTNVGLASALSMLFQGYKVVFLAPVVTLAYQHFQSMQNIVENFGFKIVLLTGKSSKKLKNEIQEGKFDFIISTHSILNLKIENLGLLIIDEMQRFGVLQRSVLLSCAARKNLLMLTATPIPRTLNILLNNIITCSFIKNSFFPKRIKTSVLNKNKIDDLIQNISDLKKKIFWVLPNIEIYDEESSNVKIGILQRFDYLNAFFINNSKNISNIFIVHGKMKDFEKIQAIENFKAADHAILVATSVIEIGLNVPDANVMIVEDANLFGLAQLHQLRGRVGRDGSESDFILLYSVFSKKFNALKESLSGFDIALKDMEIRGSGNMLDTIQHGFSDNNLGLRFLNLIEDEWILEKAKIQSLNEIYYSFFVSDVNILH